MTWKRAGPQRGANVLAFGFCLAVLAATSATAGGVAATCQARRTGDRVVASLELRELLDAEMRRLLQLGMRGQLRVEASLVRRRLGLFEQTLGTAVAQGELAAGPEGRGLLVNGRPQTQTGGPITLDRAVVVRLTGRERPDEALTMRLTIRLRVVTVASLSKLTAWVTDSSEEDASSSLVTRALLTAVANDLTRTAECSCSTAPAP